MFTEISNQGMLRLSSLINSFTKWHMNRRMEKKSVAITNCTKNEHKALNKQLNLDNSDELIKNENKNPHTILDNFKINLESFYKNQIIELFNSYKIFKEHGFIYNSYTFFNKSTNISGSISTSDELKTALMKTGFMHRCPVLRTLQSSNNGYVFSKRIEVQDEISDHLLKVRRNLGHNSSRVKIYGCDDYSFCIGFTNEDLNFNLLKFFDSNKTLVDQFELEAIKLLRSWILIEIPEITQINASGKKNPLSLIL